LRDGDEPVLLAGSLPGVPVIVCRDRARAAELARAEGADVLLLDDGFQHRRLQRDLDIVLWDRRSAQARGRLLPAGSLREATRGLARADVLLLVDRGDGEPSPPDAGPPRAFRVRLRVRCLSAAQPAAALHALTGLADAASFEASLVRAGFELTGATRYPDHHFFTMSEIRDAAARASREGAHHLAVTAKDYVRWPHRESTELPVPAVFDLGVEVDRETELLRIIAEAMEGAGR
jgi:tetraacyldisaccharide 4'-kinase